MNEEEFSRALEEQGIMLTSLQKQQFQKYYLLLVEWNEKMNLTAITNQEEVYLKHFYDSISISFDFPFSDQKIVDVGAGAGFPSIPLKIIYPNIQITIVDSLRKRITFLEQLFASLQLEQCYAVAMRAEEYVAEHREEADVVTARAVARLNILSELCLPLVKKEGYFLALKGMKAHEERIEAEKGITLLGGSIEKEAMFTLPKCDDHRTNIVIKKIAQTPAKYPRMYAKIKKQPL